MRACVLAVALTALAQPAFAHQHHTSRSFSHHRHYAHHRHHVTHVRLHHRRTVHHPAPMAPWGQDLGQGVPASAPRARASHGALDDMIARHAQLNGLPVELVHRVVTRESGYNPAARNRSGALGLMQIKYATARGVGYSGPASGLMDAETNLTYAVRYLAGAYRAAGGNAGRAVALYQSGYHGRAVARRPTLREVAWNASVSDVQSAPAGLTDDMLATRPHRAHRHRWRRK